jgi:N-acetylmuramoyl-L-alanine amidase
MKKYIFLILLMSFMSAGLQAAATNFTVIIDAGHGGKDHGAIRGNYKEKDINLAVALNLGKLIEDSFSDVNVIYTRKSDVSVNLDKRADIGNRAKGNLFISIHTNSTAAKTTSASGVDTYILGLARSEENKEVQRRENEVILLEDNYKQRYQSFDPNSPESYIIFEFMTNKYMEQSLEFAAALQSSFLEVAKRADRGVKQAGFLVLRETAMPSVLIELGFINNPDEAKYLSSAIGQRSLASAIFAGFKNYKKEFDKKQGSKSIASDEGKPVNVSESVNKPAQPVAAVAHSQPTDSQSKPTTVSPSKPPTIALQPQPAQKEPADSEVFVSKPRQNPVIPAESKPVVPTERSTATKPKVQADEQVTVVTQPQQQKPEEPAKAQPVPAMTSGEIEYRVQILVHTTELSPDSPLLKGVSPVKFYYHDGACKYTYGSTVSRREAEKILREMKPKFADAFIVAFRNGQRIK